MDYGDYYWGLYRDYYRDPFPHSLLSTREDLGVLWGLFPGGLRIPHVLAGFSKCWVSLRVL